MGFLSWARGPREKRAAMLTADQIAKRIDGEAWYDGSAAAVSTTQAMQVATVMACVRVIANGVATPACNVRRLTRDGKREMALNIPEFRLLNRRPNEWQTSFEFRRTMTVHAALTGNALAIKVKAGNRVRELIPVRPGFYRIEQVRRYEWIYTVWDEFGPIGVFGPGDVLHIPGLQWDSIKGLDAVSQARSAIGLSVAAETSQAQLHRNGGRPAGILTTEQGLSDERIAKLKESWRAFTGSNRSGTAILDGNMKYQPLAASGVDQQHLETRKFQVEEICRAFDVNPIMIGHSDKTATFASSEAFFAAHLKHTLAPWLELWRQRLDEYVLDGDGPLFVEFDTRYLSAGAMKDRAVWARTMAEMGIYSRNELREEEGKDPLPGLDDPLTPLNMTTGADSDGKEEDDAKQV